MTAVAILAALLTGADDPGALEGTIRCLAFARNGSVLVAGGESGDLRIWDARNGQLLHRFKGHKLVVVAIDVTGDGKTIASSNDDGTVRLWDVRDEGRAPLLLQAGMENIDALAFSPNGRVVVTGGRSRTIRFRDVASGQAVRSIDIGGSDENEAIALALNGAGTCLAVGDDDGMVQLWEAPTGNTIAHLRGHKGSVNALAFSPNGETIASSGNDGTVRLWHARSGRSLKVLQPPPGSETAFGPEDRPGEVGFSPDGKIFAVVLYHGSIRIWDVNQGRPDRVLERNDFDVTSIGFAPAGRILAIGGTTHCE